MVSIFIFLPVVTYNKCHKHHGKGFSTWHSWLFHHNCHQSPPLDTILSFINTIHILMTHLSSVLSFEVTQPKSYTIFIVCIFNVKHLAFPILPDVRNMLHLSYSAWCIYSKYPRTLIMKLFSMCFLHSIIPSLHCPWH